MAGSLHLDSILAQWKSSAPMHLSDIVCPPRGQSRPCVGYDEGSVLPPIADLPDITCASRSPNSVSAALRLVSGTWSFDNDHVIRAGAAQWPLEGTMEADSPGCVLQQMKHDFR